MITETSALPVACSYTCNQMWSHPANPSVHLALTKASALYLCMVRVLSSSIPMYPSHRVRAYGLVTAVVCVGTMWLCFIKLSDLECCNQKLINIYNQHCIYNFQTEIIGLSTSNHFAKQTVALKLCWKLHPLFTDYTMIKDVILKVLIRVMLTFQWHKRTFPVHITCWDM